MKKKVGIIGAGSICEKYLHVLNALEDVSLNAITSRTIHKAKKMSAKHGIKNVYKNYFEMITSENLDLIIILVSADQIFKVTQNLSKFGITLLIEKPPGLNSSIYQKNLIQKYLWLLIGAFLVISKKE